jgi:hypothetical protein
MINLASQRRIERLLINYLESTQVTIRDVAGEPHINIVRYYEGRSTDHRSIFD